MSGEDTPVDGRRLSRKAFLAGAAGGGLAAAASGVLPGAAGAQTAESCGVVSRTPDGSFANVSGYPFRSNYTTVQPCGLRVHYLDEGPRTGPVVLLAHGNPAWSYMYREWIPPLVERGYRVVAPDLVGFGKSDKLAREQYTYARQVAWAQSFVGRLGLRNINLYAQDWGGLIYLRVAAADPGRFSRIAVSNTALPDGTVEISGAFWEWAVASQIVQEFGPIIEQATAAELTPQEEAAYDAPWPTEELRQGARAMPWQVPFFENPFDTGDQARANREARAFFRGSWAKPFLTLWGEDDTITAGWDEIFKNEIPGARGLPHKTYPAGHFIQEDFPGELTNDLIGLIENY